jgi:hypothetical protein
MRTENYIEKNTGLDFEMPEQWGTDYLLHDAKNAIESVLERAMKERGLLTVAEYEALYEAFKVVSKLAGDNA